MASSYCEIVFTWKTDGPPGSVTTYSFIDTTSQGTAEEDNSCDFQSKSPVHLVKDEVNGESGDNCVLHIHCPNPEFACINGIAIVSESRTLEISNDTDGYITTVRGRQVNKASDFTDQGESVSSLYSCRCMLEENYSNLTVKFLSLGQRSSFCLQSLVINISQHTEHRAQPRGTFDINKLKKDVSEMGEAVSDRAKDLLATMEQFEENKVKNFEGLMGSQSSSSQQPWSASSQGLSSIMNSILGAGAMRSLLGESNDKSNNTNGDGPDMYKMLQAVCGSVTSMRAATAKEKENLNAAAASPDSGTSLSRSHSKDAEGEDERQMYQLDALTTLVEQKISQAKSDLQAEFSDFKREITHKLDEVTNQMNEKLDLILSTLRDLQCRKEESPPPKNKTYQDYL